MNFVALLAVLAATAFTLPLLVQGGEALGLGRGVSAGASLVLAAVVAVVWATRAWLLTRGRSDAGLRAGRGAPWSKRRGKRAGASQGGPGRAAAGGRVDAGGLRLREAEEERRAGL